MQAEPVERVLSTDLIWWRDSSGFRTSVSLLWADAGDPARELVVEATVHDARGGVAGVSRAALAYGKFLRIDSGNAGVLAGCGDGLLVLRLLGASEHSWSDFRRPTPLVDWRSDDGRLATLHSDQVERTETGAVQRFTEIVVVESEEEENAIVVLNGSRSQPGSALELTACFADGRLASARYEPAMPPFTVHRIWLRDLFPDLAERANGSPVQVSGNFESQGLWTRPYVETRGRRWGVYHGGDVYKFEPIPHLANKLVGGEVNPIAVREDDETSTFINVLHSHDGLESEPELDLRLFDSTGKCVAEHRNWRRVRRNGLSRFSIAELLPEPRPSFRGHIALSFSVGDELVPHHLQALAEYRAKRSVARTMCWSDEWNSLRRQALRARQPARLRAFYRVIEDSEFSTEVCISNAGHAGYRGAADVELELLGQSGASLQVRRNLAAYETLSSTIEALFPGWHEVLGKGGAGAVVVTCTSDLASIAFTRQADGSVLAAEHFMALPTRVGEDFRWPSGS